MKRTLLIVLAIVMLAATVLSSCGTKKEPATDDTATVTETTPEEQTTEPPKREPYKPDTDLAELDFNAQLVRVLQGSVLDVAVDLREGSATFGKYVAVELSDVNNLQLFIPRGFAHGFSVLSKTAVFAYKCDNLYCKESEGGVNCADPDLGIDWQIPVETACLSEKDKILPRLKECF